MIPSCTLKGVRHMAAGTHATTRRIIRCADEEIAQLIDASGLNTLGSLEEKALRTVLALRVGDLLLWARNGKFFTSCVGNPLYTVESGVLLQEHVRPVMEGLRMVLQKAQQKDSRDSNVVLDAIRDLRSRVEPSK